VLIYSLLFATLLLVARSLMAVLVRLRGLEAAASAPRGRIPLLLFDVSDADTDTTSPSTTGVSRLIDGAAKAAPGTIANRIKPQDAQSSEARATTESPEVPARTACGRQHGLHAVHPRC
jgi:hypothetical protein